MPLDTATLDSLADAIVGCADRLDAFVARRTKIDANEGLERAIRQLEKALETGYTRGMSPNQVRQRLSELKEELYQKERKAWDRKQTKADAVIPNGYEANAAAVKAKKGKDLYIVPSKRNPGTFNLVDGSGNIVARKLSQSAAQQMARKDAVADANEDISTNPADYKYLVHSSIVKTKGHEKTHAGAVKRMKAFEKAMPGYEGAWQIKNNPEYVKR